MAGTKFSLLGFCALRAVQNSPCFCILGKYSRYFACWESFVPLGACSAGCWESFVPLGACSAGCWESFVPLGACSAGCVESFVPPGVCSAGCVESFVLGRSFSDAVGFTVMTSLCSGCEKVRPVRSDVNANAKKFAQQGKNGLKIAVHGVLGEFFRENVACVPLLGELCRARGLMRLVPGGRVQLSVYPSFCLKGLMHDE